MFSVFLIWQLDSSDEQAAAIRRELDGRLQKVAEMEKVRFTLAIVTSIWS